MPQHWLICNPSQIRKWKPLLVSCDYILEPCTNFASLKWGYRFFTQSKNGIWEWVWNRIHFSRFGPHNPSKTMRSTVPPDSNHQTMQIEPANPGLKLAWWEAPWSVRNKLSWFLNWPASLCCVVRHFTLRARFSSHRIVNWDIQTLSVFQCGNFGEGYFHFC